MQTPLSRLVPSSLLIVCWAACCFAQDVAMRPLLTVPRVEAVPTLDGDLDEAFWDSAARIRASVEYDSGHIGSGQTAMLLAATGHALVVGACIRFADNRRPKATLVQHDSAVYTEDALEMFFAPTPGAPFYQFIVSAAGRHCGR